MTDEEIASLESHMCMAEDWSSVEVAETFSTEYVRHARFSGKIRIGNFSKVFELAGGMKKHLPRMRELQPKSAELRSHATPEEKHTTPPQQRRLPI